KRNIRLTPRRQKPFSQIPMTQNCQFTGWLPTIRMRRTPSPRQFSPSMPTTSGGKFSTLTATMLNFMEKCVGEIAGRQS
ncbi:hypothetical protein, partial [Mannheimia haemolytica]|uniref:hypothetical protein n=1 Tax=Mannheimia haemolytica TaxID=75985 RepID=UPI001C4DD049